MNSSKIVVFYDFLVKITKNVAFKFLNFGIFRQFLSNLNWPVC